MSGTQAPPVHAEMADVSSELSHTPPHAQICHRTRGCDSPKPMGKNRQADTSCGNLRGCAPWPVRAAHKRHPRELYTETPDMERRRTNRATGKDFVKRSAMLDSVSTFSNDMSEFPKKASRRNEIDIPSYFFK